MLVDGQIKTNYDANLLAEVWMGILREVDDFLNKKIVSFFTRALFFFVFF